MSMGLYTKLPPPVIENGQIGAIPQISSFEVPFFKGSEARIKGNFCVTSFPNTDYPRQPVNNVSFQT